MFREIRKKRNKIEDSAAEELLQNSRRGVLAVNGDDGYPYAIPLNYFYDRENRKIYFHGARAGHKVDALRVCDKVCFTVYGNETIREEAWAPFMQSTVVFGRCHLMENGSEKAMEMLKRFAMKYYPNEQLADEEIAQAGRAVTVLSSESRRRNFFSSFMTFAFPSSFQPTSISFKNFSAFFLSTFLFGQ